MMPRHSSKVISGLVVCLIVLAAASIRAQYGFDGTPGYSIGSQVGLGYGSNPFSVAGYGVTGGYGISPYGYGIGNGQVGRGYQSAAQLYNRAYRAGGAQTVTNYQPLMNLITLLPGWNGPVHRARRRTHSQSSTPRVTTLDDTGKILWPSTISDDPETTGLRQVAEAAVKGVVSESKSTGHASVRPVIDAKKKVWAFKKRALPAVKAKNGTDGAALESFFLDLDQALDALTFTS
jgi:hypothetical protein